MWSRGPNHVGPQNSCQALNTLQPCSISWEQHSLATLVERNSRTWVARSLNIRQDKLSDTATELKMYKVGKEHTAIIAASSDNGFLVTQGHSNYMPEHTGSLWWVATVLTCGPRTCTVWTVDNDSSSIDVIVCLVFSSLFIFSKLESMKNKKEHKWLRMWLSLNSLRLWLPV